MQLILKSKSNVKMEFVIALLVVLRILGASVSAVTQTSNIRIFEDCHGYTFHNYLTASCDTGQVISIISLKALAKRLDTRCPQEETSQTPLPSGSCCRYHDADCGDIYLGDGLQHYLSCSGRSKCLGIPIAWMDTPCRTGEYWNKTNYMRMEYNCIPSTSIEHVTDNKEITDGEVHMQNPGYPDGNTFQPGSNLTCSLETSNTTGIIVTTIFVKFLQVATGACGQQLTIKDGANTKIIACESNNNYNITDVYTTSYHFIMLTVNTSSASNNDWRFWFKFRAMKSNLELTLSCGTFRRENAQNPSPEGSTTPSATVSIATTTEPLTHSEVTHAGVTVYPTGTTKISTNYTKQSETNETTRSNSNDCKEELVLRMQKHTLMHLIVCLTEKDR